MRNRISMNNLFVRDRKILYIILSIVILSVLTLTVVYAALSTTLNISGNAEVSAASWDIYLDNVILNTQSSTTQAPTIIDSKTASFSTTLTKPGDFYEFTIDVVNDGSIDAMIDSVTKTPELTDTQKKYLNYIVEYQNGESITTKQLVGKKSFVRLKVKLEFRKDITVLDLPSQSETLNLLFKVNYVQSDDSSLIVPNKGKNILNIVSGDLNTVGSEIEILDERFYIISSDEDSITMLAKYNLYVGNECSSSVSSSCTSYGEEATGLQDSTMVGFGPTPRKGTIAFSSTPYWGEVTRGTYVYDSNSIVFNYVENYKSYLESYGVEIEEARLIKMEELESLGCSGSIGLGCSSDISWIYSTSYWTASAYDSSSLWSVNTNVSFDEDPYSYECGSGIRPVIKILKSVF